MNINKLTGMTEIQNKKDEQISFKDFIDNLKEWVGFLLSKWKIIFLGGIIAAIIGLIYSSRKPVNYTAKLTFILEEGKSPTSGLGGLASLAGQFGVDVGGGTGGGILSGDNILSYFKSPTLAREVLLTQYDSSKDQTIADVYIKVHRLKEDWEKDKKIGKVIFPQLRSGSKYSRLQDSLLQKITEIIIKDQFTVGRPDKKASFIDVTVSMQNELLAKMYCERIVQRVVERYINIKIQRQKSTVDKLQIRLDSIANLLNQKTISGASLQNNSSTMDINPLYRTGTIVKVETTLRDKTLLATIFASITQNLEMAKFTLSQETPVIQIVDAPILPLKKEKMSRLKSAFTFALVFSILISFFLILKRVYNNLIL